MPFCAGEFFAWQRKGSRPINSFEMEALFCHGKLLFKGENAGLWTRLEWENKFDTTLSEPIAARHPYWKQV